MDKTFNGLRAKVVSILFNVAERVEQLPVRGKYNRVIGGYTTSQKDVMSTAIGAIQQINIISQGLYGKTVFDFQEDREVTIQGSLAEEEGE
jgi:tRNA G37 N-methylase Trm5